MTTFNSEDLTQFRILLCHLEDFIQKTILEARQALSTSSLATVVETTRSDTLYAIDKISETSITTWFQKHWPQKWPIEIIMEGNEDKGALTAPEGTAVENTVLKCIIDPIDGTRPIMYDKRSAWILAGIAPQKGPDTCLQDIFVAAMTEIPTTKQWRADQVSGVKGCGKRGLMSVGKNVQTGESAPITPAPSSATELSHGFACINHFFPAGKSLLTQFEVELWKRLHRGENSDDEVLIFDDQYISSGGQFYEMLSGKDRLQIELRPLAFRKLGLDNALTCHPYDVCTYLLLEEAGAIIENPDGSPFNAPLDTLSPVSYVAFANEAIAEKTRPVLHQLIAEHFS